jgi:hypothetical protein
MLVGIVLCDPLFFRPLLACADKFRFEESQGDTAQRSRLLDSGRRSRSTRALSERFWQKLGGAPDGRPAPAPGAPRARAASSSSRRPRRSARCGGDHHGLLDVVRDHQDAAGRNPVAFPQFEFSDWCT